MQADRLMQDFDAGLKNIAIYMAQTNPGTFNDIFQELRELLLRMPDGQNKGYYFRAARNHAIDYIMSNKANYTHRNKFKHISFELLCDSGVQFDNNGNYFASREVERYWEL